MATKKTGDNSSFEQVNGNYVADTMSSNVQESKRTLDYQKLDTRNKYLQQKYKEMEAKVQRLEAKAMQAMQQNAPQNVREELALEAATERSQLGKFEDYYQSQIDEQRQRDVAINQSAYSTTQKRIRSMYSDRERSSRMAGYRSSSETYLEQRELSQQYTGSLEQQREGLQARQQNVQEYLSSVAGRTDKSSIEKSKIAQRELSRLERQEALVTGALNVQRKEGRDIVSQREAAFEKSRKMQGVIDKIEGVDSAAVQKHVEGLKGTNAGQSIDDATNKWLESLKKAQEANEKFANATFETAEAAEEAADELRDLNRQEALDREKLEATEKFHAGNAGKMIKGLRVAGGIAGAVAQVAATAAEGYRFFGVDHPAQEDAMKAQYARIYSRQYDDLEAAATQGDVRAQRRFFESYAEAIGEGRKGGEAAETATTLSGGSKIAAGLAATAMGAGTLMAMTGVGLIPGLAIAGLGAAASYGMGTAKDIAHVRSGTAYAEGFERRFEARMQLTDAEREIVEREEQAAMNNMRFMNQATVGFGSGGEGLFRATVTDVESMRDFGDRGMNMARRNAMMQAGRMALGVDMTAQDLQMGQSMEMAGYLTGQETIGMLGQLRDVGGSSQDLGNILKEAVAAGMDDAKSIGALVSGISSMASNLAQTRGLSTTDAAQQMMGSLLGATDQSLPASLRSTMALNAANFINQSSQDKSFALENIVELGEIKKTLGKTGVEGFTSRELNAVQSMDFKDISALANMAPDKAKERLAKMGLSRFKEISDDQLPGVLKELQQSSAKQMMFSAMGFVQNSGAQINKITKWAQAGGDPKKLGDFGLKETDIDQARLAFSERGINFETFTGALSGKKTDLDSITTKIGLQDEFLKISKEMKLGEGRGVLTEEEQEKRKKRLAEIGEQLGAEGLSRVQQMVSEGKFEFEQSARGQAGAAIKQGGMFAQTEEYDKMIKAMIKGQQDAADSLKNIPEAASKLSTAGDKLSTAGDKLDKAIDKLLNGGGTNTSNWFDNLMNNNQNQTPIPLRNGAEDGEKEG